MADPGKRRHQSREHKLAISRALREAWVRRKAMEIDEGERGIDLRARDRLLERLREVHGERYK